MICVLSGVEECSQRTAGEGPERSLGQQQEGADLPVHAVVQGDPLQGVPRAALEGDAPGAGGRRDRGQVAQGLQHFSQHVRAPGAPGLTVRRRAEDAPGEVTVGGRHGAVPLRLILPVRGARIRPFRGGLPGPVAVHGEGPPDAIRDRLGEQGVPLRGVVRPVPGEEPLRAPFLYHPVQVVHRDAQLPHHGQGDGVVAGHVRLGAVEVRLPLGVAVVQDGGGGGEEEGGPAPPPQALHDLPQIRLVLGQGHLVGPRLLAALEVVQAAVEVHHVRALAQHPLLQVLQDAGAVPPVGLRADHAGRPFQQAGDEGGVAEADGVADQGHRGEGGGRLLCGHGLTPPPPAAGGR